MLKQGLAKGALELESNLSSRQYFNASDHRVRVYIDKLNTGNQLYDAITLMGKVSDALMKDHPKAFKPNLLQ